MSDTPSLAGTPGTGPEPPPEPDGFRQDQIEAEFARQRQLKEDAAEAEKDAYEKYTGKDYPYDEPATPPAKSTAKSSSTSGTSAKSG